MTNRWTNRLRLIPFFDNRTNKYKLRELSENIPMPPMPLSKIYKSRNGELYASGVDEKNLGYLYFFRVSDSNRDSCEWIPFKNYDKDKFIEDDMDIDFPDDSGFQGAD
ncbi:MAG: hypothetical protein AABW83_01115 [Nanoarchaeota archaeon]